MKYNEEKVWRFRTWIYLVAIFAFLIATLVKCSRSKSGIKMDSRVDTAMLAAENDKVFWPPDMIPHPHPPQPQPTDGNA